MNRKNYLERDFGQFSTRVVEAARSGRLNAEPLIGLIERASIVAHGIEAVLRIDRGNTVHFEAPQDDQPEPPLSRSTIYSLLGLARLSAESLADDIDQVAMWADKHGVMEAPE